MSAIEISVSPDPDLPAPALAPLRALQVQQFHADGSVQSQAVELAAEVPVALVFNGISHAVMMATPQDLAEFAIGFALSEGVVEHARECREVEVQQHGSGTPDESCAVHIDIPPRHFMRLKERRRALVGRTGCGVCGIDSLAALDLHPAPIAAAPWRAQLDAATVLRPFETLSQRQSLNARAGSLHAAGWATPTGELTEVLEDVGRHNALDKLLGRLALAGRLGEPGFVVMTSRTSYELVRKCARLQIAAFATISAPTTLALQLAQEAGLHLWGLCRPPTALRYV
ncbi:formate dehydrogenase accessory sulfurtransferase FdhD [Melaminivora jejuensis]|uniref:formate dehydrogenase accessory sulfurtransferase FdhD n=1 Tax=Melaminivora jejuensis TaxID=1267217 RepID=UPI001AE0057D|nr:formate dehydrogenase accessory sulfurtransferase FdhD [Melaminivora jejuensis]UHJ65693.1 formate dehydrogenase accessory sulfurtransferase FdhD [Melaminivora jejuensis]